MAALLAALLCAPAPDSPTQGVPAELLALATKMRQVRSLTAVLSQEKELAALAEVVRTQGTFAFERPRRLAMDLFGPGGTRLVIDGDRMAITYKGLGKTERKSLASDPQARAIAEHLFLLLEADAEALAKVYDVAIVGRKPLVIELTPLHPALARLLRKVEATVDERGFVSQLTLTEANGDSTRWRFSSPAFNKPIPPERFAAPSQ